MPVPETGKLGRPFESSRELGNGWNVRGFWVVTAVELFLLLQFLFRQGRTCDAQGLRHSDDD